MMTHAATSQADGHADDTIANQVTEEIAAALDLDVAEVRPGCQLRDDYGCQPRDFDVLRWALEQRYGFAVPAHAVPGWKDVADVISYTKMRLGAAE